MQTVTLEFRTEHLELLGIIPPRFFDRYEEVELLETLRLEKGWRLQLVRLRHRGPLRTATELERESRRIRRLYGLESFEVVDRRPRRREYILLVRQKNPEALSRLLALAGGRITPTVPFRLAPERSIATFHGEKQALRRVLARLEKEGLPFRIRRAASHPYLADAGEIPITPRQRQALERAWALGYYAVPRRLTLTRLSRVTGQSPPALGKMLRRAEGHLVARFLASPEGEGSAPAPEAANSGAAAEAAS